MNDKVVCEECGWFGYEEDMLEAPNPFLEDETVIGCPSCKQVNCIRYACDEDDCWNEVSRGYSTDEGYRLGCYKH